MSVRRYGGRDRNRTCCLEGMNLTSCHCSTLPHRATIAAQGCMTNQEPAENWGILPPKLYDTIIQHFLLTFTDIYFQESHAMQTVDLTF